MGRSPGEHGDTSSEALRVQYEALRRLSGRDRLAMVDELTRLAREMTWSGLRRRHPNLSEAEIEERFFELTLGRDLAKKVLEHRRAQALRPGR
jgi:hypothetical protein